MFRIKNLFFVGITMFGLVLMIALLSPRLSAAQDDMNEAHRDVIRRLVDEAFNQGNVDVLDELLAEDYVSYTPGVQEEGTRDDFKQDILAYRAAIPDLQALADPIIVEGNWVAFRFFMSGTFQNDLVFDGEEPIPPTGLPVTIVYHIFARFNEDGQLVEEWDLSDSLAILEQFGMLDDLFGGAAEATEEAGGDTGSGDMVLDGDALINERCTVCHTRERIDQQDKDEAGWTDTVSRMISYGAQLNDEERQAVIDYLAETH